MRRVALVLIDYSHMKVRERASIPPNANGWLCSQARYTQSKQISREWSLHINMEGNLDPRMRGHFALPRYAAASKTVSCDTMVRKGNVKMKMRNGSKVCLTPATDFNSSLHLRAHSLMLMPS